MIPITQYALLVFNYICIKTNTSIYSIFQCVQIRGEKLGEGVTFFVKTQILLPKLYKKLYTGIISYFLGSFTNFVIGKVSQLSTIEHSKKLQDI